MAPWSTWQYIKKSFFTRRIDPESLAPGQKGEPVSREGNVVDRDEFEKMKDEYYKLRGWDIKSGLQTRERLTALHLTDIADNLEKLGLLK